MYKFKFYLKIHTVKSTGSNTQQNNNQFAVHVIIHYW